MRMPMLSYTIKMVVPNVCTKFRILGALVSRKSLTQISLCITLEREMEKKTNEKKLKRSLMEKKKKKTKRS